MSLRPNAGSRPARTARPRPATFALLATGLLLLTVGAIRTPGIADAGIGSLDKSHRFATPIWSGDLRGNIATIGNVATTCRSGAGADPSHPNYVGTCEEVLSGAIGGDDSGRTPRFPANNEFDLVYVDVDDDPATHNSSMARLDIEPDAEIVWAGLHWHGLLESQQEGRIHPRWNPPVDPEARFRVTVTTPTSEKFTVDADDRWDQPAIPPGGSGHRTYGAYADVTDLVRTAGDGRWTVGDIQTCTGPAFALGCIGGWTMTVVYAAENEPARNLNVWHGWDRADHLPGGALQFDAGGIVPPPAGGVAELGIVAADGDRGRGPESVSYRSVSRPDWVRLGGPGRPLHPDDPAEFFNSTIDRFGKRRPDGDASPNPRANLNLDIALIGDIPIAGDDDLLQFRIDTSTHRDTIYAQVVHTAVPLFEPEIEITKTASVDVADPGDRITWTLEVTNVGIEPIRDARVRDFLPAELEFVDGSIDYRAGGPPDLLGSKSAEGGDDEARWDDTERLLELHVGAGATAESGGTMAVPDAGDGSDRIEIVFDTIWHGEPGADVVNEAVATGFGRDLADDPFGPITVEDRDDARVLGRLVPLLVQDKIVDQPSVLPGDNAVFTVSLHNQGLGEAPAGSTVVDDLPEGLEVVEIGADGLFDPASRTITWSDLPAIGVDEVWTADIVVTVEPGRWAERFTNRMHVEPPEDTPVRVDHPCEDDPSWSCAPVRVDHPPESTPPPTPASAPPRSPASPPAAPDSSPPTPDRRALPRTGIDPSGPGLIALGLVFTGTGSTLFARGRRRSTA